LQQQPQLRAQQDLERQRIQHEQELEHQQWQDNRLMQREAGARTATSTADVSSCCKDKFKRNSSSRPN